ncbi:hypothetical protein [Niameybacter massiliensis]|uniref:hypothetical protein n=1 Tax=Niameybacter massiliensis TaxID=1658108 RepID=UPI0006B475A0|nr:hypothetical protein [Niameybacter massiliensis]
MELVKIIMIVLLLFICALLVEKALHMSFSLKQLVYQLKTDIRVVIKALTSKEVIRHCFSQQLAEELKNVSRPYSNITFDIDIATSFNSGTPFIGVHFIPHHKMEVEELNEVTNLLLLKFRRYLLINNLSWKTFACFSSGHDFVRVYLYYAEVQEDSENFKYRYKMTIRENTDTDYGILEDDDLNKELDDVD